MPKLKTLITLSVLGLFFFLPKISSADATTYQDLVISDIIVYPSVPAVGQDAVIKVKVKNNGTFNLYSSEGLNTYGYSFPDFNITGTIFPALSISNVIAPGAYFYYEYSGKFTAGGSKKLSFEVDKLNTLLEKDVQNNLFSKTINVLNSASTDLSIYSIEYTPEKPLVNQDVTIKVKLKNIGPANLVNSDGLTSDDVIMSFPGFEKKSETHDAYPTATSSLAVNGYFLYTYQGQFHNAGLQKLGFSLDRYNKLTLNNRSLSATSTEKMIYFDTAERDAFTITDIQTSYISSTSVAFYWNTSENSIGKVGYHNIYNSSDTETLESTTAKKIHSMSISGLLPGQIYYFRVMGTNSTVTKSSDYFPVALPADDKVIATALPQAQTDNAKKTVTVQWQTNLLSKTTLYYKLRAETAYRNSGFDSATTTHAVILSNLPTGIYDYYVISTSSVKTAYTSPIDSFELKTSTASNTTTTTTTTTTNNSTTNQTSSNLTIMPIKITNQALYQNLKGKIIIKVESKGEAYYVSPLKPEMYFLGKPADAFQIIRQLGVGITNENLEKIKINNVPAGTKVNTTFAKQQSGKILLQVQNHGEAWYVYPNSYQRYFMQTPDDAFYLMKKLGLGISNNNFSALTK